MMICIWKTKFLLLGVFILVNIAFLSAQNTNHGRAIDEIVGQIEREQNVGSLKEIELEEVDPKLFEELGDSVMGELIGDEKRHEWIDEMMGGEGSAQLASAHRSLGIQYIQNGGKLDSLGWGMMGPGMMWGSNRGWNSSGDMMRSWSPRTWIIVVLLLAVFSVIVILLFRKQRLSNGSPLDLLQARYAKGEIPREDFLLMREDLK